MSMKRVLVTGATGRTGSLVFEKLQQSQEFAGVGLARSPEKAQERFGSTEGLVFGDICDRQSLQTAMDGCQGLVILTSAVPQVIAPPSEPGERPQMGFAPGSEPEIVDYQGQVNQIDVAKAVGVQQVVLVGSMGGTDENHFLNRIGNGKILVWKRKAEQYLMDSGLTYTIIRAGGLLDEPGGDRELLVGDNDELLSQPPEGVKPSIPRADVAELVVQALREPTARNTAFDVISNPEGLATRDFAALFARTTAG
ncbi:oxidoreductase [Phormidium willei BDU 130791]|nr:oxidoreductase [Phormidium willei BDU 130791]